MNETITLNGKTYPVRRNARRKNISVISDIDGNITVALPAHYKISGKTAELLTPLLEEIIKRAKPIPQAKKYTDGEKFLYRGAEYPLKLTGSVRALEFDGNFFFMNSGKRNDAGKLFERWYKRALENRLSEILPALCKRLNVSPAKITVKSTSSVWGSCSRRGNISFCTRLALLPREHFEYIVVHELCHLIQMNHSAKFWAEVEKIIPDYKKIRAELNKNGHIYKWW